MLNQSVLILRAQQHVVNELMKINKIKITPHMAFGYEANSVSIKNNFNPGDDLILSHRNIAYNLAFDLKNFKNFLFEFNLDNRGINCGKNGSMNIINPNKGIPYTSSILGNNFSVALGISLSKNLFKRKKSFTFVVTGDGAIEEGTFIESIIIASKFKTNYIIIVENNDFAMASTIKQRRNKIDLNKVANAYNINYLHLMSRNVDDYVSKIKKFKEKIIKTQKPGIIEFKTKMFNRHAGATPGWPTDPLKISFENGLLIEKSKNDPVYYSQKKINKITQLKIYKKYKDIFNSFKI